MFQKSIYLVRAMLLQVLRKNLDCPNCGQRSRKVIDRKYLVTTLCRCPGCRLLHRIPRDAEGRGKTFYQAAYRQGFTTEMPNRKTLRRMVENKFRGGPRDYRAYLELLERLRLKKGDTLLEYGCSWGYGAWQLQDAGYEVKAFEISKPRCRDAREELGIRAVDDPGAVGGPFDVVFSAHVPEHVDQLEVALARQWDWLKPGGLLVGVTPNGSAAFRQAHPRNFHRLWGLVHPQLLDDEFLSHRFSGLEMFSASLPTSEVFLLKRNPSPESDRLTGWEPAFAVRKPPSIHPVHG